MIDIDIKIWLVQIFTFLVGMWLLWITGFKYLGRVLEERREQIKKDLEQAQKAKQEIEKIKTDYEGQVLELRKKSAHQLDEAIRDANTQRMKMVEEAKVESKSMLDKAKQEIEREADRAKKVIRNDVAGLALLVAEKVLKEKIDESMNKKVVSEFLSDLNRIN